MTKTYCVLTRDNVEIWITADQAKRLSAALQTNQKFVSVNGNFVNTKDITGIYDSETMLAKKKRRRGLWQANNGSWYSRNDKEQNWRESMIPTEIEAKESLLALAQGLKSKGLAIESKQAKEES